MDYKSTKHRYTCMLMSTATLFPTSKLWKPNLSAQARDGWREDGADMQAIVFCHKGKVRSFVGIQLQFETMLIQWIKPDSERQIWLVFLFIGESESSCSHAKLSVCIWHEYRSKPVYGNKGPLMGRGVKIEKIGVWGDNPNVQCTPIWKHSYVALYHVRLTNTMKCLMVTKCPYICEWGASRSQQASI